jgi:hypothetical protein
MKRYLLLTLSVVFLSVIFTVGGKAVFYNNAKSPSTPLVYSPKIPTPEDPTTLDACQYEVRFAQSGVGSDFTGTVVTIDGANYGVADLPVEFWWDWGSSHNFAFASPLDVNSGMRYTWNCSFGLSTAQSDTLTIYREGGVTANYVAQNAVTFGQTGVDSDFTGTIVTVDSIVYNYSTLPVSFWWDTLSSYTFCFFSPLVASTGKQYVWTSTTGLSNMQRYSMFVSSAGSVVGNYKTQYHLTVVSPYATPSGQGWYDNGTTAYATLDVGSVDYGNGTRRVFTGWSGDASGTDYAQSNPIAMNGPKTAAASWKTQYTVTFDHSGLDASASGAVLTVNGSLITYGQLPYANWVDSGSSISYLYGNVSSSTAEKQFILVNVTGLPSPITVTSPVMVTGKYKTQYQVTFNQTGVGFDFTTTVVTVDSNGYTFSSLPVSFWWDNSSLHTFSFLSPLTINASKQYNWFSTSGLTTLQNGTLSVSGSGSVMGNYAAEYKFQITFNQIGVIADFTGTVVTIDGANYTVALLPASFWWDNNSIHTFAYQPLLAITPGTKQYAWISTLGLSTLQSDNITVATSGNITGTYKTQYYLTLATNPPSVAFPSGAGWYDAGTNATVSTVASVDIVPGSSRYRFNVWTTANVTEIADPTKSQTNVTMDSAKTVTANYVVQYIVAFNQSGVGSDFTSTILTVDGGLFNGSSLPYQFWWDNGSSHMFAYQSPLVATSNGKQYVWTNTTGLLALQSGSVTVTTNGSIAGNYKTQYYLTVNSAHDSPNPVSGWFDSGASITESVTSPASGPTGTQYACTGWTGTGSVSASGTGSSFTFAINAPSTITWNWKTQYYFTVASAYDSPSPVSGWFDSGASITASVTSPTPGPSGTQYLCTGWAGTGSVPASGATQTVSFTIAQPSSITWNWQTQYYLTVASPYGTTGGQGWYDGGSIAYSTLNTAAVDHGNGTRRVFTGWSGDASGTDYAKSNPIAMNGPKTAVANWKTQYTVTFDHSGLDPSASGTIATVNSSPIAFGQLPYSIWVDSGGSATYAYGNASSAIAGKRFILIGTTGILSPITVTSPVMVTGNYKTQYQITFNQTGVGNDFTGIIVSIDGSVHGYSGLPTSFWWDSGSSHAFAFQSPLIVTTTGKQYAWTSTSGLSTLQNGSITVTASGSIVGNSKTEYFLTVTSPFGTPSGQGWYDSGATANARLDTGTIDHGNGTRRVFANWIVNASGTNYRQSDPIQMNAPKTASANWKTEYRLIVRTNGLGTNSTNVYNSTTVLGTATDATPYTGWFEEDSLILLDIDSPIANGSARYVFAQWSGDVAGTSRPASVAVDAAKDVTANYELARMLPFFNKILFIFTVGIIGTIGGLILLLMLGLVARRRRKGPSREYAVVVRPHV